MMKKMNKYVLLSQRLAAEIQSGHYRAGDRLPSENELASYFGLSRQTVRQAHFPAGRAGLITRRQGSGSIVNCRCGSCSHPSAQLYRCLVITTYIGEYIFPDIMRGIEQVLNLNQYAPLISAIRNRVDSERRILLNCLDRLPDGLIVEGTKTALPNPNIDLYQKLYNLGIPTVFINGFYPGSAGTDLCRCRRPSGWAGCNQPAHPKGTHSDRWHFQERRYSGTPPICRIYSGHAGCGSRAQR